MPLFKIPVKSSTDPEELVSVNDEINDFLNNFADFKSLLQDLTPPQQLQLKTTFNDEVKNSGTHLIDCNDMKVLKNFTLELQTGQQELLLKKLKDENIYKN